MEDKLSPREARDAVAAQLVRNAQKNGQTVTFEQAQRRVGEGMKNGDLKRDNNNR